MKNQEIDQSIWNNKMYLLLFSSYTISTLGKFFDILAVMLMFSYVWQAEPVADFIESRCLCGSICIVQPIFRYFCGPG